MIGYMLFAWRRFCSLFRVGRGLGQSIGDSLGDDDDWDDDDMVIVNERLTERALPPWRRAA